MTKFKLDFEDDDLDEPYTLVAIHCSEEEYKVSYLLNLHLELKLARSTEDLDLSTKGVLMTYPLYEYEDTQQYSNYYLIANSSRREEANSSDGLFGISAERSSTHYLIPELRKVDYCLKIYSDFKNISRKQIITDLNEIKQIISAYTVEIDTIKSRNNLIIG